VEDKTIARRQGGQTVHEETAVQVDVVVQDLGLKEDGKTGGTPEGI
jgi:hypothetical protein